MSDTLLPAIVIEPETKADASIIWLHGLGADGHDFKPIVPQLNLPAEHAIRFIFPHAPIRPVTINGNYEMRAWFDIYDIELQAQEDHQGIQESHEYILSLIKQEMQKGIDSKRIILAGFSQGGAMALYSGLRFSKPLGGIIGLSTYLPLAETFAEERNAANNNTPIFMAHGNFDPIVLLDWGKNSYRLLKSLGYRVHWRTFPTQHQVCPEEIESMAKWLIDICIEK